MSAANEEKTFRFLVRPGLQIWVDEEVTDKDAWDAVDTLMEFDPTLRLCPSTAVMRSHMPGAPIAPIVVMAFIGAVGASVTKNQEGRNGQGR